MTGEALGFAGFFGLIKVFEFLKVLLSLGRARVRVRQQQRLLLFFYSIYTFTCSVTESKV